MRTWLLVLVVALLATACTSEPATEEARDLLFAAEAPQPTEVPPADAANSPSTVGDPPVQLAFTDWTVDELITALERSLDGPTTVTFAGQGEEILEMSNGAWRVTSGVLGTSSAELPFTTRGFGDEEWVTFDHVAVGIRSMQVFSAGTTGSGIDELLAETDESNPIADGFRLDRYLLDEANDLQTMWVDHIRTDGAFFAPSVMHPRFVEELLADVTTAVAAAATDGVLETSSTDSTFSANIPTTEFVEVMASGDEITLTSRGGWTLTVASGVEDEALLGPPNPRDELTRELLLTATSIPAECITTVIEAGDMVDNGIVRCNDADQAKTLLETFAETGLPVSDSE